MHLACVLNATSMLVDACLRMLVVVARAMRAPEKKRSTQKSINRKIATSTTFSRANLTQTKTLKVGAARAVD